MLQELVINTTVQMLLLALAAGVFLGGAIIGTSVAIMRHRTRPVQRWVAVSSGAAWLVAVALAALVVYVGTASAYVTSLSRHRSSPSASRPPGRASLLSAGSELRPLRAARP